MSLEILEELQTLLENYVKEREEARTWGGPTIYPPHPINEHNALYYSRKLKEIINDSNLQNSLSSRQQ